MNAKDFVTTIYDPAASWCAALPAWRASFSFQADVLLVAISGQESAWSARVQGGNGPARGFWQFEQGGGVTGVLKHPTTARMARDACAGLGISNLPHIVWAFLGRPEGDRLALAFARLLLWSDPRPLPAIDDPDDAYDYYVANWRPGAPGPDRWPSNHAAAREALGP
jgi:hypothetical protein